MTGSENTLSVYSLTNKVYAPTLIFKYGLKFGGIRLSF